MILTIGLLALFVVAGAPIIASLGVVGTIDGLMQGLPLTNIAQAMYHGVDSFTLLAVPLFILAGEILFHSGSAGKLVSFMNLLVGRVPGGLGVSAVASTMVFSGLSGSVNADAAAISSAMLPSMEKAGYRKEWSSAIIAAAAGTGILIPPSITIIVLATVANMSVTKLFLAATLPAILVGVTKMFIIMYRARSEPPVAPVHFSVRELGRAFLLAIPALGAPIIILGGIFMGFFTATESAAAAVAYVTIITLLQRSIPTRAWSGILIKAGRTSAIVLSLVGVAQILGYMLAYNSVGEQVAEFASQLTGNRFVFTVFIVVVFWLLGALLDGIPALILLIPLFLPIAQDAGYSDVHFAILAIAIVGISLVTPPIGTACFIVTGVANIRMVNLVRPMLPFMAIMFVTILLLAFVPAFSEWLPHLLY
ncbi:MULTISPECIES: TRAP transporter large permease [unclassified Caballeronia]|uniref:TRAP transporter large permease n=1 Tax=unclassified Caballeronia TaxID=2646786 RepID=UPI002859D7E3|nr:MULTISPECIES: TRAP transporter large permease [unclassified Caballeronia]MDR5818635.1 TRAP transporter large permease [Caballeronia sp. LZ033]MDR5825690.1 TRAP transporter large permease [Caballeronia sp. LZ043]MDR5884033.1 TRAP transporter large permease [Caballeronia sp. LZ032]